MDNLDVVNAYNRLNSLERVSLEYGISEAKVKKILISEGACQNDTSKKIQKLYHAWIAPDEIAG